jgi:hypothetical protein
MLRGGVLLLTGLLEATEADEGLTVGFGRGHARAEVVLGGESDVGGHLALGLYGETVAAKEG